MPGPRPRSEPAELGEENLIEGCGVVGCRRVIAGAGHTMRLRLVASKDEYLEPVLRRVPTAAAQLGEESGSGTGTRVMQNDVGGLGDEYEAMLRSRGLNDECGAGESELSWGLNGARARGHYRKSGDNT